MPSPERVLALQGATNFRDLGGYVGHGGRPLRWRRVFRSDHLAGLTAADREALATLGVARSLDFRGVAERAAEPYELPGLVQHSLAIEPSVAQRMGDLERSGLELTPERMVGLMTELYLRLVGPNAARFAEFFEHLRASDEPLVFHCTAGKDRTGIAAALLLLALGVPRDEVMRDYLLTNEVYRHPHVASPRLSAEALAVLWSVRPEYLTAALTAIEAAPGGLEGYLTHRMGLTPAVRDALSARYLE